MLSRTSQLASAILLSACFAGAQAQTPAAPSTAKTPTPQQQRMSDCNKAAEGKKGDDRKTFMSSCLKGEEPAKQLTPQQQKMKDCNAKAGEQKLTGEARKTFMSTCLKG